MEENTMIYMYMYYKLHVKVQSTIYYKLKYLQIMYVGGYECNEYRCSFCTS